MNPWDYVLVVLGWAVLVFLVIIFVIIFVMVIEAIVVGVINRVTKRRMRRGVLMTAKKVVIDTDVLYGKVKAQGVHKYHNDFLLADEKIAAFVAGAEYLLNLLLDKEETDGNGK